jgi:hypothetical protein
MESPNSTNQPPSTQQKRLSRGFRRIFVVFWVTWAIVWVLVWPFTLAGGNTSIWEVYADAFQDSTTAIIAVAWVTLVPILLALAVWTGVRAIQWIQAGFRE